MNLIDLITEKSNDYKETQERLTYTFNNKFVTKRDKPIIPTKNHNVKA